MLRKIEAYIHLSALDSLRAELVRKGISGMSHSTVDGFGTQSEVVDGIPQFEQRLKIEVVVHEEIVEEIIKLMRDLCARGDLGAGMLFVIPVEDAVRLATLETGTRAIH